MDADYDIFEIVAVVRDFWLFDAECYQRRYSTNHKQPLAPGYYVVNWPEHIRIRRFTQHAAFHGPFIHRKEAQAALNWMQQEQKRVLAGSPKKSSSAASNANGMAVKKSVSQRLRPAKDIKATQPMADWNPG